MTFIVATFYHFFDFRKYAESRQSLNQLLDAEEIKGSLLIAAEGINGTLSGRRAAIDRVLTYLKEEVVGGEFEHKESVCDRQPFGRAKVRLKKEVISLGEQVRHPRLVRGSQATQHDDSRSPNESGMTAGRYVEPKNWNTLIADSEVTVLDARNSYEIHLGTFERAIDPKTRTFKELPAYVKKHFDPGTHKHIATFCTGGIRCEKFSAWLLAQGFENVYQLRGGILKYLEEIPAQENKFRGECYVFDERVAVGHGLTSSLTASQCPACGHALTAQDRVHALYIEGKRCRFCKTE